MPDAVKHKCETSSVVKITFSSGSSVGGRTELLSAVYRALYGYDGVSVVTRTGAHELSVVLKRISVPPLPEIEKGEKDGD